MKEFRTTGPYITEKHYMVDISDRISGSEKWLMTDSIHYKPGKTIRQATGDCPGKSLRKTIQ